MTVAACLKWVDRRLAVDPLTGAVLADPRSAGASDADQAALEWALRAGAAWNADVMAITAGPPEADAVLRDALAAGATRAVRVDMPIDAPSDVVAASLATCLAGCGVVWCGDASLDRGTGAVPAYLAARLDAAQALGLVAVDIGPAPMLTALRRLDGGRRERLRLRGPAVCSVEGSTARLRRAPLAAAIAARTAVIEVHAGPVIDKPAPRPTRPFRPRPRVLPPPEGATALERITALTAAAASAAHSQVVTLDPVAAADLILEALVTWGYV